MKAPIHINLKKNHHSINFNKDNMIKILDGFNIECPHQAAECGWNMGFNEAYDSILDAFSTNKKGGVL